MHDEALVVIKYILDLSTSPRAITFDKTKLQDWASARFWDVWLDQTLQSWDIACSLRANPLIHSPLINRSLILSRLISYAPTLLINQLAMVAPVKYNIPPFSTTSVIDQYTHASAFWNTNHRDVWLMMKGSASEVAMVTGTPSRCSTAHDQ